METKTVEPCKFKPLNEGRLDRFPPVIKENDPPPQTLKGNFDRVPPPVESPKEKEKE